MRALRFIGLNLVWFAACFTSFFYLDKTERGGVFTWQSWHLYAAMVATAAGAFLLARLHDQMKPEKGPIALNRTGSFLTFIVNTLLAFAAYAVVSVFIYGE